MLQELLVQSVSALPCQLKFYCIPGCTESFENVRLQPPMKQGCKHLLTGDEKSEGDIWPLTEPRPTDSSWNIRGLFFDELFELEIKSFDRLHPEN